DKPTKQVMIEARLVEVTANPKQSYGINWAGVVGGSTTPKNFSYGQVIPQSFTGTNPPAVPTSDLAAGNSQNNNLFGNLSRLATSYAILTVPQMSLTLRALN